MHKLHSYLHLLASPSPANLIAFCAIAAVIISLIVLLFRLTPQVLLAAATVLEVFSGFWKYMGIPLPLDRAVLVSGFAVLAWSGVRYTTERRLQLHPVHVLMLALVTYTVCSALWAGTLNTSLGFYAILDRLGVIPFVMFTIAPLVFRDRHSRNVLLVGLVGLGLYLAFTANLEGVGLLRYVEPSYIRNPNLGIHFGRARGPFLESVADGLSMFMCSVAAAVALRSWLRIVPRLICGAVIVLSASGILFTLTRTNWLAAAAGTIIAMGCDARLRRKLLFIVPVAALGVVATLVLVPGLSAKAGARTAQVSPVWDRYNTNAAAIRAWESHPIFGIGWETFIVKGPSYLRQADGYPLTGAGLEVHNVLLSHLTELGVLGAVLWLLILLGGVGGAVVRRGPRTLHSWRLGLIAIFVAYLISASLGPMSYPLPNLLLWLWTGIVASDFYSVPRSSVQSLLVWGTTPQLVRVEA